MAQPPDKHTSMPKRLATATIMSLAILASAAHAVDPKASAFYENALVRYEKRDLAGAIIQLRNALQVDKTLLPVHLLLGKALMENGDVAAAEVAFSDAMRLGVDRSEVVVPMAQALLAQGRARDVLDRPEFGVGGLPAAIRAQLLLVRAAASGDLGDDRAALSAIEEARSIDPRSASVWLAEVPLRIRKGELADADAATAKALSLAPDSLEGAYFRAAIRHAQGNLVEALAGYDKVLDRNPASLDARISRAGIYIDLNRLKDAQADVDELKKRKSNDPRASYMRALLAERQNRPDEARAALKELTHLIDPVPMDYIRYRPQLLMLNGLAHYALGSRERATVYLEAFHRMQSDTPASKVLAQVYVADSRADKAVDVLEAYLRARPNDAHAMILLASALMSRGQDTRAAALMQRALEKRDVPEFRTVLGLSLLRSGESESALEALEAAVKRDPKQVASGLALIGLYLGNGQPKKAASLAQRLSQTHPQNPQLQNLLGMSLRQSGDAKGATTAFEKALTIDPAAVGASLNLARMDVAAGKLDSAATRLAAVIKAHEKSAEAMFEMSIVEELRHKPEESLRWLEKAQEAVPDDPRWGLAEAELHLRHGDAPKAVAAAKRVASRWADELVVLATLARAQVAAGDNSGAQGTLSAATRVAEYKPEPQVRIALLQLSAGNPSGAAYSLGKALSGQPDYLPALALLADVEIRQGELVKAEQRARSIVARYPRRGVGHGILGDIALAKRDTATALEEYRQAHTIEPTRDSLKRLARLVARVQGNAAVQKLLIDWARNHPGDLFAQRAVGDAYSGAGNFKAARSAYEAALKLAPNDGDILNNLANVLSRLDDKSALAVAERAYVALPGNPAVTDTLGWILYKQGNTDRSLQLLRDARLRDPGNAETRYHLAAVLAKAGRKTEARLELDAALSMSRNFDDVDDALALAKSLASASN